MIYSKTGSLFWVLLLSSTLHVFRNAEQTQAQINLIQRVDHVLANTKHGIIFEIVVQIPGHHTFLELYTLQAIAFKHSNTLIDLPGDRTDFAKQVRREHRWCCTSRRHKNHQSDRHEGRCQGKSWPKSYPSLLFAWNSNQLLSLQIFNNATTWTLMSPTKKSSTVSCRKYNFNKEWTSYVFIVGPGTIFCKRTWNSLAWEFLHKHLDPVFDYIPARMPSFPRLL